MLLNVLVATLPRLRQWIIGTVRHHHRRRMSNMHLIMQILGRGPLGATPGALTPPREPSMTRTSRVIHLTTGPTLPRTEDHL